MEMLRKVMLRTQLWFGCGGTDPTDAPNPFITMFSINMFELHGLKINHK